ncbi:MAG: uroporphyrinogen-III C-methyltransferase [Flavobacteriaceae bacterium]|nr:MAG: uroporphyrinogen-III C-methyltransferase [Flavobacteriaceae bacterium]
MKNSKITLVGAGPGDEELLTIKGMNAIKTADAIFYDALVNIEILKHSKKDCKLIYVGKRRGVRRYSQDQINKMMVEAANENEQIVRLKGGDPFVFGRGTEELNYVESYGIKTDIIPGISSALAVPANQGIPLTKRGINESFFVITGTTSDGSVSSDLKFGAQSTSTLIILMGLKNLNLIMEEVILYRDENCPFAVIQSGTREEERIFLNTIINYKEIIKSIDYSKPGIIVIGDTVAEHPAFFEEEIQRVLHSVIEI